MLQRITRKGEALTNFMRGNDSKTGDVPTQTADVILSPQVPIITFAFDPRLKTLIVRSLFIDTAQLVSGDRSYLNEHKYILETSNKVNVLPPIYVQW